MSHLTTRAEQALLGALLAGGIADDLSGAVLNSVQESDFGHRAHAEVFTALSELRTQDPGLSDQYLIWAVRDRVYATGTGEEWLWKLREAAGLRQHLPAYAEMIETAALRRDIANHATQTARFVNGPLAAELANALQRNATANTNLTADDATLPGTAPSNTQPGPAPAPSPEQADELIMSPEHRGRWEDALLADLLHNPEQADVLAQAFPYQHLSTHQRQEVYRTILILGVDRQPVDEVIVAYEIEQQRANDAIWGADPEFPPATAPPFEPDVVYLDRLAHTDPPVTAVTIAEELLVQDIRTLQKVRAELENVQQRFPGYQEATPLRSIPMGPEPASSPMPLDPGNDRPAAPQAPTPQPEARP